MPASECALCMFWGVHSCVYMYMVVWLYCAYLKMWAQVSLCVCVHMDMCADLQTDGGVCKGVSAYDDGEGGLFVI